LIVQNKNLFKKKLFKEHLVGKLWQAFMPFCKNAGQIRIHVADQFNW
jgi:hypothetical protein